MQHISPGPLLQQGEQSTTIIEAVDVRKNM
jgi:hypothetical protein